MRAKCKHCDRYPYHLKWCPHWKRPVRVIDVAEAYAAGQLEMRERLVKALRDERDRIGGPGNSEAGAVLDEMVDAIRALPPTTPPTGENK